MSAPSLFAPSAMLRVFQVHSDNMEPAYRRDSFAFVVPVDRYEGEGAYVVTDALGGMSLHRFDHVGHGRMRMLSDNPRYPTQEVTSAQFEAMVVAKVAVCANVVDWRLMRRIAGDAR